MEARIAELEAANDGLNDENEEWLADCNNLAKDNDQLREQNAALKAEIAILLGPCTMTTQEMSERLTQLQHRVESWDEAWRILHRQVEHSAKRIALLQQERDALQATNAAMAEEVAGWKAVALRNAL